MNKLWLFLYFPHLQLDTLFSEASHTHPVVVLDQRKNTVLQLNAKAKDSGISLNMGLATAAMLDQNLQVIPYQAKVEQQKLQEIAAHLYLVTSDICLFPPNGLLLQIHNMLGLYGGLPTYWHALKSQLDKLDLTYHYATGHSPYAAKMLACAGQNHITQDLTDLKQRVNRCTLAQTELPDKVIQKLNRVGINRISALLALPLKDIAKRFDIELVTYLGRLTGEFQHPVHFHHPSDTFEHYLELLYEIADTQRLHHPLGKLLTKLELFLKARDLITQQLLITFHQRDKEQLRLQVDSAEGEYLASRWLALCELKLENLTLTAPIVAITLCPGNTNVRSPDKQELFGNRRGTLTNLQLISLLQARLGSDAVKGVTLNNDFRPEVANVYAEPLANYPTAGQPQAMRPSFLLCEPQILTQQVSILRGPERLHTGWWDSHQVTRDYFIARSQQGQWYWVFRTPQNTWYLHGIFS